MHKINLLANKNTWYLIFSFLWAKKIIYDLEDYKDEMSELLTLIVVVGFKDKSLVR